MTLGFCIEDLEGQSRTEREGYKFKRHVWVISPVSQCRGTLEVGGPQRGRWRVPGQRFVGGNGDCQSGCWLQERRETDPHLQHSCKAPRYFLEALTRYLQILATVCCWLSQGFRL
jgi:hypothetical protein